MAKVHGVSFSSDESVRKLIVLMVANVLKTTELYILMGELYGI